MALRISKSQQPYSSMPPTLGSTRACPLRQQEHLMLICLRESSYFCIFIGVSKAIFPLKPSPNPLSGYPTPCCLKALLHAKIPHFRTKVVGMFWLGFVPLCKLQNVCCILLLLVPKMVLTFCTLYWWCSVTSANTQLTLIVVITCNLHWWCFFCHQLA